MDGAPSRIRTTGRVCFGLFVSGLLMLSCGDDHPAATCPTCQVGAVEGYVTAGGFPAITTVGARCGSGLDQGEVKFQTTTDSTGWYRLEMPVGPYRIEVRPCQCGLFPVRDTIHVSPAVRRIDFPMGRAKFRLRFPPELAGTYVRLALDPVRSVFDGVFDYVGTPVTAEGGASFDFPVVKPIGYRMRLELLGQSMYLPGTIEESAADSVVIPSDHPLLDERSLESLATISGSVRGSWQVLGAYAPRVTVFGASDSIPLARGTADPDGSFRLIALDPRPVKLLSEISSVRQWFGGDSYRSATTTDLRPGDRLTGVDQIEGGIKCILIAPESLSVQCANLLLRDEHEVVWSGTGSGPEVAICNLRAGRYFLHVDAWCSRATQTWAEQWFDGASSLEDATPIEVEEGQVAAVTFHLIKGGRIEGHLARATGAPAWWCEINLFDSNRNLLQQTTPSSSDGGYVFNGLGDGSYYMEVPSWGLWYPGTTNPDSAQAISIAGGTAASGLDWHLPVLVAKVTP
jgi:hypothetical protein